jgi:hypothetical protein
LRQKLRLHAGVEATDVIDELTFAHGVLTSDRVLHRRNLKLSAMNETEPSPATAAASTTDPLLKLHKMSRTAGLATTEYVAVNPLAVAALFFGVGSALVTFSAMFLVIPAAAVVMALFSLWQIRNSNGTQTGRGLAWCAIALSVLFSVLLGSKQVAKIFTTREDKARIDQVIVAFGDDIAKRNYGAAYRRASDEFRARISEEQFAARFETLQSSPEYGEITAMKGNGIVQFDVDPKTNAQTAGTLARVFVKRGGEDRIPMPFRKRGSEWIIDDLPAVFPKAPTMLKPGQRLPPGVKVG